MAGLLTAVPIAADAGTIRVPYPDPVAAELRRWARAPFDLARANCGLSVLRYVARMTGVPVPAWLGAIGRAGALRLMADDAAFVATASRALDEMGCPPIDEPRRGDIALVRMPAGLTAAICTGPLWAARGDRFVVVQAADAIASWGVTCPRR